ncbi:prominin-1-A-like isoform X2 [Glandiceps talaboti]
MESRSVIVHILAVVLVIAVTNAQTTQGPQLTNENNDGTITWADLPTPDSTYTTPDEYDEGPAPLPAVWSMMYGWINTISPGSVPYGKLGSIFSDLSDMAVLIEFLQANLTNLFLGFAACITIGILFLLIFPIVCCCFCCCRMCGNCGGKMHQKHSSSNGCKKIVFLVVLSCISGILGFGVACGYFTNERTGDVLKGLDDNIIGTLDDVLKFSNNTVDELKFVAIEQTTWLIGEILSDFSNIGDVLGGAIRDALGEEVQPAIDSMIIMVDNIEATRDGLNNMNTLSTDLNDDYGTFCTALDTLRGDVGAPTCGVCNSAIPSRDLLTCKTGRDFSDASGSGSYPRITPADSVTVKIAALDAVLANDPKTTAEDSKATFDNIPDTVSTNTATIVQDINTTFSDFITQIDGQINPLIDQLSGMTSGVTDIKDQITGFSSILTEYDQYRWYAMTGLHAVVLLVVVFNLIGILFGMVGSCTSSSSNPTKRSGLSNCGGLFLMASAGFCFIFACFYMFLTTIPFMIGAPINKFLCQPLLNGQILESTIDNSDGFMGSNGYFLGDTIFGDGTINFTVTGTLNQCDNGATSYTAFGLENLVDISKYTDFSQYIDDSQFNEVADDIDLSGVEIMSTDTENNLNQFKAANVAAIDWSGYDTELAGDLTDIPNDDLDDFLNAWETWAAGLTDSNDISKANAAIAKIRTFNTDKMIPMKAQRDNVEAKLATVKDNANSINSNVDNTIASGNDADDFLADSSNIDGILTGQTDAYKNRITSYLEQFSSYITNMLKKEVGKCEPVANVIDNVFNLICRSFLDPFNAFWFVNGWYVFFFMPSIIFGVKLAKFFRRMKTADSYEDDDDIEMKGYPDDGHGAPFNNKVAAGPI